MKINEAISHLKDAFMDWSQSDILINPLYMRDGSHITWTHRVPHMLDHPVMNSDVAALVEEKQYTFQVEDGSVIQIYYNYDSKGNTIQSARLAFYKAHIDYQRINKIESSYDNMESMFFEDTLGWETYENEPVSWLRIEYAPEEAKGVLHHECHMHVSAFPYSRLPVAGVPNPRQFVEFVIALCYPHHYQRHRLDTRGQYVSQSKISSVNSNCVPWIENEIFSQIAHIRIPTFNERRNR